MTTTTTTPAAPTARQIIRDGEQRMADLVRRATGRTVEITHRGGNAWTVAGQPDDVRQAVALMLQAPGATLDDQHHDDELGETFAYITFPA